MSSTNSKRVREFQRIVLAHWNREGRHDLPWRKTRDPYRIMLSEVMLQQTQVSRVIEKYKEFLKTFPNTRTLARASLSDVLKVWSGMGYNRRAKYLRDAAQTIVEKYGGRIPKDAAALRALPGIGEYTASAIRAFAFNEPTILIETNVRTAIIHHFASEGSALRSLGEAGSIRDSALLPLAQEAADGQDPRTWNWALMDYGAYLKRSGVRVNARSAHYVKQKKFEGSLRQLRGKILRDLHLGKQPPKGRHSIEALKGLARDGLIEKRKGKWQIA